MQQSIEENEEYLISSPNIVTWFIDRTPTFDNTIVYNNIPTIEVTIDSTIEITEEQEDCCICFEKKDKNEICRLNCSHTFCGQCIDNTINNCIPKNIASSCPLCRVVIQKITVKTIFNYELLAYT